MKYRVVAGIAAAAIMLTGCGSLAGRHNIDSGFTYIESHDFNNAMKSFEVAEEKGEDICLIHRGKGIVYLRTGEYEKAAEELLASLAADEGIVDDMDFDTNYYLAEAYSSLGEYTKAKEVYDAILGLRSSDQNAYYLRGVAELGDGNHDAAYSDFSKAIALNARNYSLTILIYQALANYGYEEEAKAILALANCGVPLVASAHAASAEELCRRPPIKRLLEAAVFERVVGLARPSFGRFSFTVSEGVVP